MTTFTKITQSGYDASTDTGGVPTPVTVEGTAVRVKPRSHLDVLKYRDLSLIHQDVVTLFFVPNTYGETPEVGAEVEWAGTTYIVRDVDPIAPDGVTIAARIVVSK